MIFTEVVLQSLFQLNLTIVKGRGTMKNRNRSPEIIRVIKAFSRNGLGYAFRPVTFKRKHPKDRGIKIRKTLEELGTTYIKLGQLLSTRYDLFPQDILEELAKLQDSVPPFSFSKFQEILTGAFGDIGNYFIYIQEEPLASASVAQVHRALLLDGTEVVIKLRRPDIVEPVRRDIEALKIVASFIQRFPLFKDVDIVGIVEDFGKAMERELNFLNEYKSLNEFNIFFESDKSIFAPIPFREMTRENVLVTEYIPGIRFSELVRLPESALPFKVDKKELTLTVADSLFQQIFTFGFLHSDPHPGNLIVTSTKRIYYLDFGQISRIDSGTRDFIMEYFISLARRDSKLLTSALVERFSLVSPDLFEEEMKHMFGDYYGRPLKEINMTQFVSKAFRVIRKHRVRLPSALMLMTRVILMAEGIGHMLNPDFNIFDFMKDFFLKKQLNTILKEQFNELWENILWNAILFPRRIRSIERILDGQFIIEIYSPGTIRLLSNLVRAFKGLAAAIIVGSILMSLENYKDTLIPYMAVFILAIYITYELIFGGRRY